MVGGPGASTCEASLTLTTAVLKCSSTFIRTRSAYPFSSASVPALHSKEGLVFSSHCYFSLRACFQVSGFCVHFQVDVEEFEDIKSGYKITLKFAPNNPFFNESQLVKVCE